MEAKAMDLSGQETERLYYKDSHRKEFEATVLSCEEKITKKERKPVTGSCWTGPHSFRKAADSSGMWAG